ncbi:MAG: hypothetical protein ACI9O4_000359 [Chitinophagales bacterium]|jgi:hypothetical protein
MNKFFSTLLLSLFALSSFGQWNPNPSINTALCTAQFKQKEQRLESDGNGGAFIVWRDWRIDGFSGDIYVQRIDANGNALWGLDGIVICNEFSDEAAPSITTDEKDGIIIAWSDERTGLERDVYAQRIDGNGNILWTSNGVPVADKINREHSEKIISDDNGGAIVVWEEERVDATWDIWAQRIDSLGNVVWQSGGVPFFNVYGNRINHKIQRDGEGGVILTCQDARNGDFDIYAQRLDADGNRLWGGAGSVICNASGVQTNPKIDPEKEKDGVYIAWTDKRNSADYDIYANRVDSNGVVLWGNGKPVAQTVGNQSAIDILSNNKTQGLIVSWKDNRASDYDIYLQKLSPDGDPVWQTNGVIVCDAAEDQLNPNIISDKKGGAIVVWQDGRSGEFDVYSQRMSKNGIQQWLANGEPVCTAVGDQFSPKNIPDNKGGAIYVWEDKREGTSKDIYAHHLLFNDTAITGIQDLNHLSDFRLLSNPFEDEIKLSFSLRESTELHFSVLDLLGKELLRYSNHFDAGQHSMNLSTEEVINQVGVYFLAVREGTQMRSIVLQKR